MKFGKYILGALPVIAVAIVVFVAGGSKVDTNEKRVAYIESFGWRVEKTPLEEVSLILPQEMNDVYKNYNELQREVGLDITPYLGKPAIRYTYKVTNHKNADGRTVRANILVCNEKVIAGDIMVVEIDGFMHSLGKSEFAEQGE